jgi:putative membrane protein
LFCLPAVQATAQMSPVDQTFATKAASGGLVEASLGQLAMKNANAPQVRQFGQQMVTDHTQANQELQVVARQQNLTLPDKPNPVSHAKEQRLQAVTGTTLDTAYVRDMVQDHQQNIADFQQEATSGKDPALMAYAHKYLPVLKHHLEMTQTIVTKG